MLSVVEKVGTLGAWIVGAVWKRLEAEIANLGGQRCRGQNWDHCGQDRRTKAARIAQLCKFVNWDWSFYVIMVSQRF